MINVLGGPIELTCTWPNEVGQKAQSVGASESRGDWGTNNGTRQCRLHSFAPCRQPNIFTGRN